MTKSRCVVVTGGESGIGAACAVAFGEIGDDVAILFHSDEAEAKSVADKVTAAGGRAKTVQCDVSDEASVAGAFVAVEEAFGPAVILVNSAGVNMSGVAVRDMDLKLWNRTIGTDLTGAFLVSRRFLKACDGPGVLIHISSIHAEAVRAGGGDYCAAKGGLSRLVETIAVEEAPRGIRANAVQPGMILTPMNARAVADVAYRKSLEDNIPMKRAGEPSEVAAMVRWLASDEAAYVTGAAFTVDGGLSRLQALGA